MVSLFLSRRSLSSPTICRFIPAHYLPSLPGTIYLVIRYSGCRDRKRDGGSAFKMMTAFTG